MLLIPDMKILFICTHNRCRSILAEAITNHLGGEKIQARSAGSSPSGKVHPLSIKYLKESGIATEKLKSEHWDKHENWQPDIVITVCDNAAGETCPAYFGDAIKLHWGLKDPSAIDGSEQEVKQAFLNTIAILNHRIDTLMAFNFETIDDAAMAELLKTIAE